MCQGPGFLEVQLTPSPPRWYVATESRHPPGSRLLACQTVPSQSHPSSTCLDTGLLQGTVIWQAACTPMVPSKALASGLLATGMLRTTGAFKCRVYLFGRRSKAAPIHSVSLGGTTHSQAPVTARANWTATVASEFKEWGGIRAPLGYKVTI